MLSEYGEYTFKVNDENARLIFCWCSKFIIKTTDRVQWCRFGVSIANLKRIQLINLKFYSWLWTCNCFQGGHITPRTGVLFIKILFSSIHQEVFWSSDITNILREYLRLIFYNMNWQVDLLNPAKNPFAELFEISREPFDTVLRASYFSILNTPDKTSKTMHHPQLSWLTFVFTDDETNFKYYSRACWAEPDILCLPGNYTVHNYLFKAKHILL